MKRKNSIVYFTLTMLQLMMISSGFFLNYLSSKKAGVMRHIYTKGLEYQNGIYSPDALFIHQILMIGAAGLILVMWRKKKRSRSFESMFSILIALGFILMVNLDVFRNMIAYTYILMGFEAAIFIGVVKSALIKETD